MEIKQLQKEIHQNNVAKGFYEKPVECGTRLMLITSELAEALEADRKEKRFSKLNKDYREAFKKKLDREGADESWKNVFQTVVKDTFEDEIADAFIRLLDLAEHEGIDLEWHVKQKIRYNSLREYKHGKKY